MFTVAPLLFSADIRVAKTFKIGFVATSSLEGILMRALPQHRRQFPKLACRAAPHNSESWAAQSDDIRVRITVPRYMLQTVVALVGHYTAPWTVPATSTAGICGCLAILLPVIKGAKDTIPAICSLPKQCSTVP